MSSTVPLGNESIRNPIFGEYLTTVESAALLKKSPRTLERWRRLGGEAGPPWTSCGSTVLYSIDGIREWLASREQVRGA